MSTRFTAPKGTFDVIPPASAELLAVRDALLRPVRLAGYSYIETPIFEDTTVFARGVGESTDVVSKEMYTFTDRGGRSITLRPELTAGLMRAAIQHQLYAGPLPVKLYSVGANFRYERPQAGRYRHFSQVDVEALGTTDPALDAEVVALADAGYHQLGLVDYTLQLNSLGDTSCRPAYRERLLDFLETRDLDEATKQRAQLNPLRVLDDKRPEVASQLADAPLMMDYLCDDCRDHFDEVRSYLQVLGVRWELNPRLVRGLDYYTRTTFEFVHNRLGAQASIGGGGRYDGLAATLGGPDLPGIGYAVGVDRTLLAMQAEAVSLTNPARVSVFVVPVGAGAKPRALVIAAGLRSAGISADIAFGDRGLKGSMKAADRSGARYAVVLGEREIVDGTVQLKDLSTGTQETLAGTDLTTHLTERLS